MSAQSHNLDFSVNVARYSALRHMQKRLAARCAQLPQRFEDLDQWQTFRDRLVTGLRGKLPVWELGEDLPSPTVAHLDLSEDLLLQSVDVHLEEEFFIPVHVYQPQGGDGELPAVVVCPGYGQKKNDQNIIDICMALARAGMLAVAVEYDGTGERADRPEAVCRQARAALVVLEARDEAGPAPGEAVEPPDSRFAPPPALAADGGRALRAAMRLRTRTTVELRE